MLWVEADGLVLVLDGPLVLPQASINRTHSYTT